MGCASRTPKLLETVVELSPSPALVTGADLVILLVNRELERRFGYAREELLGNPVTILLPQGLPPGGASPFAPDVSAAAGVQVTGRHKNGSPVPLDVQVRHIDTTDGPRLIAYLRDGAERPARDDHRPSLEAQLEFERFLGGLSFEFINLPSDRVTDAIREGVARTCQMLAFDRGCFCRAAADDGLQDLVVWSADGIAPLHDPQPTRDIFPWTFERVFAGELITFETPDEIPDDTDRSSFRASNVPWAAFLPLSVDGQVIGAMGFETLGRAQTWTPEAKHRLTMIGSVFAQVLARQQREAAVRAAFEEVQRLKDRLQVENVYLRKEERELLRASRFVGQSPAIRRLLTHIQQVAPTDL